MSGGAGDNKTLPELARAARDEVYSGDEGTQSYALREATRALLAELAAALEAADDRIAELQITLSRTLSEATERQARLVAVEAAAKHARSQAAAPDYDEEAIRDALWAVVAAVEAENEELKAGRDYWEHKSSEAEWEVVRLRGEIERLTDILFEFAGGTIRELDAEKDQSRPWVGATRAACLKMAEVATLIVDAAAAVRPQTDTPDQGKKYTQAELDFFSDNADEYFAMANRERARCRTYEEALWTLRLEFRLCGSQGASPENIAMWLHMAAAALAFSEREKGEGLGGPQSGPSGGGQ